MGSVVKKAWVGFQNRVVFWPAIGGVNVAGEMREVGAILMWQPM